MAIFTVAAVAFLPLVFPLFCAPFAFLGALARHPFVALAVKVCRGAGFGETYRVSAYATGLSQLASLAGSLVPIIGPLLALGLAVYVSGLGIKGAHGTNARTVVSSRFGRRCERRVGKITFRQRGWRGMQNGLLIELTQREFDALLTLDQGIPHKQSLKESGA